MSAHAAIALATALPDPATPGADRPSGFAHLLGLVRRLIDYGKELATTLQQRATNADLAAVTLSFGTRDIALILARITRGLLLAGALEGRLVELAARPEAPPKPTRPPAEHAPRVSRPAAVRPSGETDPRLAPLPTPEQIAAEVRRRPVGAVIADICRDLGILPSHPLFGELSSAIIGYGGSLARLFTDVLDRVLPIPASARHLTRRAASPAPPAAATGPP